MGILRNLASGYALDRMSRGQRRRRMSGGYPAPRFPYGRPSPRRRRRGGGGFFGPIPYYSGTTRRGTRVQVGGCCLPIPLAALASVVAVVTARRRLTSR